MNKQLIELIFYLTEKIKDTGFCSNNISFVSDFGLIFLYVVMVCALLESLAFYRIVNRLFST